MKLLDRYILRSHVGPFFFGLSVITFVLIMDLIYKYLDLFISKGVPIRSVSEVFVLSLAHMFALSIPMAVLVATLMAFGQLSGENEVVAMKANGISVLRMIQYPLILSVLLAIGLTAFNNFILPEANHNLLSLLISIRQKNPSIEIKPNVFIKDFEPYTIYIGKKDDKTGLLEDLRIYKEDNRMVMTIAAERGYFTYFPDRNVLQFELQSGEIHEFPEGLDITTYRKTEFGHYIINIPDVDRNLMRREHSYRGDREMTVPMMVDKVRETRRDMARSQERIATMSRNEFRKAFELLSAETRRKRLDGPNTSHAGGKPRLKRPSRRRVPRVNIARTLDNELRTIDSYGHVINRYLVEIHKKFSIPVACIVFVLLGAPLAIRSSKGGMTVAIGLSILFFLVYYLFLIGGEKIADRGYVAPWLAMWAPNLLLGALGAVLLRRSAMDMGSPSRPRPRLPGWIRIGGSNADS